MFVTIILCKIIIISVYKNIRVLFILISKKYVEFVYIYKNTTYQFV